MDKDEKIEITEQERKATSFEEMKLIRAKRALEISQGIKTEDGDGGAVGAAIETDGQEQT